MTLMEENGERAVSRDGRVTYEGEARVSRKHILDFEEILKDIDGAIHNNSMGSNSKTVDLIILENQIVSSCNLVDIKIMEDDPSWDNQIPESKVNQMERNSGDKHFVVEFYMGWADTGLSGVDNKSRPNKSGGKGKPKLKPKSGSVVLQGKALPIVGKSPKQGIWIREATRRPDFSASSSLEKLRLVLKEKQRL